MPSLPPHIPPQSTPQKHAEQRTEGQRLVRFYLLVRVCVVILYNTHRPHCVYCVYLCWRSQKSCEFSNFYLLVISHSRQATLYVGGAICWKPSRQRQGHRENLTQHPASLDLGTSYYKHLSLDLPNKLLRFLSSLILFCISSGLYLRLEVLKNLKAGRQQSISSGITKSCVHGQFRQITCETQPKPGRGEAVCHVRR